MIDRPRGWLKPLVPALALLGALALAPDLHALDASDAAGACFGRAVPIPGQTVCSPGDAGCEVPNDIVMAFTLVPGGAFVAVDSLVFSGAVRTTAQGQWEQSGPSGIKATFTLLQSAPTGAFIGSFKNLLSATLVSEDQLEGRIDAFLYTYVAPSGEAIVDADGFPTPSPLGEPSSCITTPGCNYLGAFSFIVRRVKVQ